MALSVMVAVAGLMAGPAEATEGAGGGTGTFSYQRTAINLVPPCSITHSMSFLSNDGYSGSYSDSHGAYVGGLAFHATAEEPFYAGPPGAFYDAQCTHPRPFVPVRATVTSTLPQVGTSVTCDYKGTFSRVSQNYVFSLWGSCSVNGGPAAYSREVHEGVLTTCQGVTCNSVDTYVAAHP